jgi:hypothetical protein
MAERWQHGCTLCLPQEEKCRVFWPYYVGYYRNASCVLILLCRLLQKRVVCSKIYVFIYITDSMCINHSCKSNGYSLKNCEINPVKNDFKILSMVVKRRLSRSMYTRAVSYGFYTKAIWVSRGCRADFSVCFQVFDSK